MMLAFLKELKCIDERILLPQSQICLLTSVAGVNCARSDPLGVAKSANHPWRTTRAVVQLKFSIVSSIFEHAFNRL